MEQHRGIYKLLEEMSELSVELAKLGPFPDGNHPGRKKNLRQSIENELADVQAALLYFASVNDFTISHARVVKKLKKFNRQGLSGVVTDGTKT
jgi:NTP pyrophosphatase (non-canonical NTP hydrolase)